MAEIGRRIVHASGIGFPALFLLDLVTWRQLQFLLVLGCVIVIVLEALRLKVGLDWWIYEALTRPYEAEKLAGYALYMFSITLVAFLFDPVIALPAMLMLMLGDPVSGYLGADTIKKFGDWTAMLGMFVVCTLLAVPFAFVAVEGAGWAVLIAAVSALCATLADAVKPVVRGYVIDDNLTIPLAGALSLWVLIGLLPPA